MSQPVAPVIDQFLEKLVPEFCDGVSDVCRYSFLTGSYARGSHDPDLTNINVYFVSEPGGSADLRMALSFFFKRAQKLFRRNGYDLEVDCHPFTIISREVSVSDFPRVVITTKVLDSAFSERLSLPPTIGLGWLESYRSLWGEFDLKGELDFETQKMDQQWFQAIHQALCSYKSILDHLPWATNWHAEPRILAIESFRYAEEAIRDALPILLSEEELNQGYQFNLYFNWGGATDDFFRERLGEGGLQIKKDVADMKQIMKDREVWEQVEAIEAWKTALSVWQVVWNQFSEKVKAEHPELAPWMLRVNAFV